MRHKFRRLGDGRQAILGETKRAVTPFGGLGVLEAVRERLPFSYRSPNAIGAAEILVSFWLSVSAGARRFSHVNLLRGDVALRHLLGWKRLPRARPRSTWTPPSLIAVAGKKARRKATTLASPAGFPIIRSWPPWPSRCSSCMAGSDRAIPAPGAAWSSSSPRRSRYYPGGGIRGRLEILWFAYFQLRINRV